MASEDAEQGRWAIERRERSPIPLVEGAIVWKCLVGLSVFTATLGFLSTGVGLGWFTLPLGGPGYSWQNTLMATGFTTITLLGLAYVQRRGQVGVARGVSLLLSVVIVYLSPSYAFEHGIAQVVWIGPLVAFALTSVRFSLFTTVVTMASVWLIHGDKGAFHEVSPIFVTVIIATLLAVGRVRLDNIIQAYRVQAEAAREAAYFDGLTGLPNRRALRMQLTEALAASKERGQLVAVLFVDIDHFKQINETMGHDQGDEVLRQAAWRLSRCVEARDVLARFGADVFTIVHVGAADRQGVDQLVAEVRSELARGYLVDQGNLPMTASVGIALSPDDGLTADALLQHADQALHMARAAGGDQSAYYLPRLHTEAAMRLRLSQDLRGAIDREELEVYYQPIVELPSGRICKAEALVRWKHPALGWVSPATFIPVAESSGLIHALGDWVLLQAASQLQHLRSIGHTALQVSVNRSPVQFANAGGHGSAGRVGGATWGGPSWRDQLRALNLPGDCIAIEITEGLLLNQSKAVADELDAVHAAGISISLDDFGTGYSALSYLHRYPIDIVKIDRSFVHGLAEGARNLALCRAIVRMAHDLGMRVVAEGVETAGERDLLAAVGCDYAQGYFFGRPMPAADFQALLDRDRPDLRPVAEG